MKLNLHNWDSPTSSERLDVVFEHRNQLYGAYALRKEYSHNTSLALLYSLSAAVLLVLIPGIYNYFNPSIPDIIKAPDELIIQFDQPDIIPPQKQPANLPSLSADPNSSGDIFLVRDSAVINETPPIDHQPPGNGDPSDNDSLAYTASGPGNGSDVPDESVPEKPFLRVEEMPMFPGGESEMMKYIVSHIHYPEDAKENKIQGTVYLSFVIDKKGNIKDPAIVRGIGAGCEEEALRVLKGMPGWSPGKQNGKEVNVQFVIPVKFTLR